MKLGDTNYNISEQGSKGREIFSKTDYPQTGVYELEVDDNGAFFMQTKSEATFLYFNGVITPYKDLNDSNKIPNTKRKVRNAKMLFSSGRDKGHKTYYYNEKSQSNIEHPGFTASKLIAIALDLKKYSDIPLEETTVEMYGKWNEAKAIKGIKGKKIIVALINTKSYGKKKNPYTNQYEDDTSKAYENIEIDQIFSPTDGLTYDEKVEKKNTKKDPIFSNTYLAKFIEKYGNEQQDETIKHNSKKLSSVPNNTTVPQNAPAVSNSIPDIDIDDDEIPF